MFKTAFVYNAVSQIECFMFSVAESDGTTAIDTFSALVVIGGGFVVGDEEQVVLRSQGAACGI